MRDPGHHLAQAGKLLGLDEAAFGPLAFFMGFAFRVGELLQLAIAFFELPVQLALGGQAGEVLRIEMDHVLERGGEHVQELFAPRRQEKLLAQEDDPQGRGRLRVGASREGAMDAAGDFVGIAVLGDEPIGAGLESPQNVDRVGLAGTDDDGDRAEAARRP